MELFLLKLFWITVLCPVDYYVSSKKAFISLENIEGERPLFSLSQLAGVQEDLCLIFRRVKHRKCVT